MGVMDAEPMQRRCPDDGRCWHGCQEGGCWRVETCEPLSGVFPRDEWPAEVVAREAALPQRGTI